jgi:endonuclease-3
MYDTKHAQEIITSLSKLYPRVKTALENWTNEFQFLASIMMSAQTTDKQVNKVTAKIFQKYITIENFAEVNLEKFQNEISSIGFFRNKARNIINCAKILKNEYNSKIPRKIEELVKLPGVGRKTANVFLNVTGTDFQGIAVDTHVKRLSNRLGLTKENDPVKIENDLMKVVKKKYWEKITLLLIEHGRNICKSRKPHCEDCVLNTICPSAFKV